MQRPYSPYDAPEVRRAVRSEPLHNGRPVMHAPRFSLNKPIAILLWALACVTTYQLVAVLRPDLELRILIGAAITAQLVLTWLERPILNGRPNKVSSATLLVDTLVNAGGIFPMALRAADTPPAQMLIVAFKLSPTMSPIGGALLALVFGFLLAASPEAVWRWKE